MVFFSPYKYLLIPDLSTVALPVLPQSGGQGHVLDPRGSSCLHSDNRWYSTLPGHDVRKTQGGPQKRQEHRGPPSWGLPQGMAKGSGHPELYAPTVILKGTERHSSSSLHNNDRPWIQGHCLADAQTPKTIILRCNISIPEDLSL